MDGKLERVVQLVDERKAALQRVADIEAELEALLGGGAEAKPTAPAAAEPRGTPPPARPVPLAAGAPLKKGDRQRQIIALAKEGLKAAEMATRLGVRKKIVHMALWQARNKGLLPAGYKQS